MASNYISDLAKQGGKAFVKGIKDFAQGVKETGSVKGSVEKGVEDLVNENPQLENIKDTVNGVKSFLSDTDNLKQVASMALPVAMMAFMNKFFPEESGDNSINTNTVEQDKLGWE